MRSREAMVTVVTFIGAVGAVLLVIGVAWSAAVPVVPGWFLWLGAIVSGAGAGLLILAAVVAWRWHHAARRITRWERRGDRWILLDGTGAERATTCDDRR